MNDLNFFGVLLAFLCICRADPVPLEQLQLPPGFTVSIFTNSTPKARSLAVSGGAKSIVYISNDLLVSVWSLVAARCHRCRSLMIPTVTSVPRALTSLIPPHDVVIMYLRYYLTGLVTNALQPGGVYGALDSNGDGVADQTVVLLSGLNQPNGIAWHKGSLYVAEVSQITRYDNADASVVANQVLAQTQTKFACRTSDARTCEHVLLVDSIKPLREWFVEPRQTTP